MSVSYALPVEGAKAPAFSLPAMTTPHVSLCGLKGKAVVLYFYPKDNTPGCHGGGPGFRDLADDFSKPEPWCWASVPINIDSHRRFTEKFGLNYRFWPTRTTPWLRNTAFWVEKSMYGKILHGHPARHFPHRPSGKTPGSGQVKPEGTRKRCWEAVKALA